MTATIYLLFFTTFSVMLELILRSFGLYLPLAALFLFYAAIVFGYRAHNEQTNGKKSFGLFCRFVNLDYSDSLFHSRTKNLSLNNA